MVIFRNGSRMKDRTERVLDALNAARKAQEELNEIILDIESDRDTEQEQWEIGRGPEDDKECWTFRPYTDLIEMLENFVRTLDAPVKAADEIADKVEQISEEELW